MTLSRPSRSVERIALVMGVVSSACLGVASFAAFGNPREAGWSRLNELVSGARNNVRAAWESMTKVEGVDCVATVSPTITWTKGDLLALRDSKRRIPPSSLDAAGQDGALPRGSLVFDALFAASLDAELGQHDEREALALVEEALKVGADQDSLARARLRATQLAVRMEQHASAVEHARRARDDIGPNVTTNGTSTVLLAVLAALPSVPEGERVAFAEPLVNAWTDGALWFPDAHPRLQESTSEGKVRFVLDEPHVESALRARLIALCGTPTAWLARFAELDRVRTVRALQDFVGRLPEEAPTTTHWTLFDAGPTLLAVHADGRGSTIGQLVDRAHLSESFQRKIAEARALPAGFVLDLDGDRQELGEPVGIPMELSPAIANAALRHPDVAGVLRRAESRTTWMRAGLVVLAVFVGGAALAMHFALRRERRLFEARAAFVAGVSHELRTPLASILLMAENLENGRAGANADRYHLLIRREALRLRRLVDDVLDFSRLERGRRFEARIEDVETAVWFDALAEESRALAAASEVDVVASRRELPQHAAFDGEAVRRAVLNLVVNALRHSKSTRVEITASVESNDVLLVTVADHGKGIPARERDSIFEPFARLAGSEGTAGAGLGLAIVREIARAHGGDVKVRDRDAGSGAVFELRIRAPADVATRLEFADGLQHDREPAT